MTILLSLIVVVAVLLVLVILAQNSKGGGLSSQFGGSGASNMIGVKKTGDLLSNLTWGLVIVLFALTVSSNFITASGPATSTDEFIDRAQEQNVAPSLDLGDVDEAQDTHGTIETKGADQSEGSGLEDLEGGAGEEDYQEQ